MTPKEKAQELCNKFLRTYKVSLYPPFNSASQEAKQCALIAVEFARENPLNTEGYNKYLDEVKQEIENL